MNCLGLDIGGANLKAASLGGWAKSVPFALWRNPGGLANALRELIAAAPPTNRLAVTMTGELCDCFSTKADGVRHILDAVRVVAEGREVAVYLSDGRFVTLTEANAMPELAAASNWRALADFVRGNFAIGKSALLVDIGSTTTDIIPIVAGHVAAVGRNDTERLRSSELVYTGVGRTPVCAVVKSLPYRDGWCPVAAELFSTTADAYLILGRIAEDPSATWTADGRPLVLACARQRLARQVCGDVGDFTNDELYEMAAYISHVQQNDIRCAIGTVVRPQNTPDVCIASGNGDFLALKILAEALPNVTVLGLSEQLGRGASACAPAFAVCVASCHRSAMAPKA